MLTRSKCNLPSEGGWLLILRKPSMKKIVDLTALELERMGLVDLGDAAVETLQHMPVPVVADSTYGLGYWY